MKKNILEWLCHLRRKTGGRALAILMAGLLGGFASNALGQSSATVTTLADAKHGKPGYKNGNTFYQAQFRFPAGLCLDPSGSYLFVADMTNNAVRMITSVGDRANSLTYSVFTNKNWLNRPVAIAIDQATNIYVLNRGNGKNGNVLKFNGYNLFKYWIATTPQTNAVQLTNATALAIDYAANLYATVNSNTVIRIAGGSNTVVGIINTPNVNLRGIVVQLDGKLALTDAGNNGIWVMDPANPSIYANATPLTGFVGAGDMVGPPGLAAFNRPEQISKAGGGFLVVADYNNGRVKIVDTNGNVEVLYGCEKQYWTKPFAGWRDGTMQQGLITVQARQPFGVTVAKDGTVYTSETFYNLLRVATGTGLPALPPPPPSAPAIIAAATNLNPVNLSASVTITWTPVSTATNYFVKRAENPGGPYAVLAGTSETTYTDQDVTPGKSYYYVVSASNATGESPNSAEVKVNVPYAPVTKPQIGYVDNLGAFHDVPFDFGVAYNDLNIVIKGASGSTIIYTNITTDGVATNSFTTSMAGGYNNQLDYHAYLVYPQPAPYMTIKAHATKPGYPDSQEAQATFQFRVSDPIIAGENFYKFTITELTANAQLFYTLDGSDPRVNGQDLSLFATYAASNNTWSVTLPGPITTNVLFQVWALRSNYQPSAVISKLFYYDKAQANGMSFGSAAGPGSSRLVASPGQSFVLPVSINLLPDAPPIYGLQFSIGVTNLGTHAVAPGAVNFQSLVGIPAEDGYFSPIPNLVFISTNQPNNDPGAIYYNSNGWYQSLQLNTGNGQNLLGVGWLEIFGRKNLYDTTSQNLLTYPLVNGTDYSPTSTNSIIGAYSFDIPSIADANDVYQVQIFRPSATTFDKIGYGKPVTIEARSYTNFVGPGFVNAMKNVTIGQIKYLVGDVYPANWYNAGDFGSGNLVNIDVTRVFDFAAYPIAHPPESSDLFDAMDSCGNVGVLDGTTGYYTNAAYFPYITNLVGAVTNYTYTYTNDVLLDTSTSISNYTTSIYMTTYAVNVPYTITTIQLALATTNVTYTNYVVIVPQSVPTLFDANDTSINQIAFGDGVLDICDVYVTFRRSLDPSLQWFQRFWTNSVRVADTGVTNHAASSQPASATAPAVAFAINSTNSSALPQVVFSAGTVQVSPGQTVQIPIKADVYGNYPARLLMLNLSVVPINGAPIIANQIQFTQTANTIGAPYTTESIIEGNYASVWLNRNSAGLTGNTTIGVLTVTIPANAPSNAQYGVYFDHASASPNGLAPFPCQTINGAIICGGSQ